MGAVLTRGPPFAGTYAVLGKRRARVLREELREGSDLFSILAFMPAQVVLCDLNLPEE